MKTNIKTNYKIAIIINILIVLFTVLASILMFTGIKFMHGVEPVLEVTKLGMFKFFTVDSNVFMAMVALAFAIEEYKIIKGTTKEISTKLYIFKLMSTTAVTLTFIVVFSYLGPFSKGGIPSMIRNSNLFFHLLTPVASIIGFTCFEKTNKITFKQTLYSLIPTFLYAFFYITNIIIHSENGKVSTRYDWYWFVQNGTWTILIVIPLFILVTHVISYALWKCNKYGINNNSLCKEQTKK